MGRPAWRVDARRARVEKSGLAVARERPCVLDPHRLKRVRVQSEQPRDRGRDRGRLHRRGIDLAVANPSIRDDQRNGARVLTAPEQAGPTGEGQGVEAEGDETESDRSEEKVAIRLGEQEYERAAVAVRARWVSMQPGLQDEPTHERESDATGEHPEAPQPTR